MFSKLRHPIRSITEPYGKAGLLVAILALVLATTGAAFAAAGLTGKQKKEVAKIAKKFAGKPGAAGASGPAGPAGAPGKDGTNGSDGRSVVLGTATSAECSQGSPKSGVTVEVEGSGTKKAVCNGKEGKEGSPWTAGGTLPTGSTETGMWNVATGLEAGPTTFLGYSTTSFQIPLASAPTLIVLNEEESKLPAKNTHATECPGSAEHPEAKAASGFACFYTEVEQGTTLAGPEAHPFGALLVFSAPQSGLSAWGVWAVTG